MSKLETIRRLLVGDVRRVLRHRYGPTLPDDDAGRDDLQLLLRLAAVAAEAPREKMQHEVDIYAPWAGPEAGPWMDDYQRTDPRYVWVGGKELGERLNLSNAERERLKAWRIVPVDMTADALAEQRRAKDRERKRRKRRTCAQYLADSINTQKPWLALGISRRTYFRRVALSPSATRTTTQRTHLVPPPEEASMKKPKREESAQSAQPPSTADALGANPSSSTADTLVQVSTADTRVSRSNGHKMVASEQSIRITYIIGGKKWTPSPYGRPH